ncbi:hypothetical protein T440DRAFT_76216 [Plenodomus tracheiphilus IPT5]|uniref:Uncharacterized protein n=1 Tax=Plenodomus tracheiphilus IPT5 TaxID=1408161 RepID=A0A6A7B622_9PLEO|nr:hypothetical protein T440DRAFT_76216 [Plenodomus tracheiphilus IPT5]
MGRPAPWLAPADDDGRHQLASGHAATPISACSLLALQHTPPVDAAPLATAGSLTPQRRNGGYAHGRSVAAVPTAQRGCGSTLPREVAPAGPCSGHTQYSVRCVPFTAVLISAASTSKGNPICHHHLLYVTLGEMNPQTNQLAARQRGLQSNTGRSLTHSLTHNPIGVSPANNHQHSPPPRLLLAEHPSFITAHRSDSREEKSRQVTHMQASNMSHTSRQYPIHIHPSPLDMPAQTQTQTQTPTPSIQVSASTQKKPPKEREKANYSCWPEFQGPKAPWFPLLRSRAGRTAEAGT